MFGMSPGVWMEITPTATLQPDPAILTFPLTNLTTAFPNNKPHPYTDPQTPSPMDTHQHTRTYPNSCPPMPVILSPTFSLYITIKSNRSTVAQMAERAPHDLKVVGSNPASGSYENCASISRKSGSRAGHHVKCWNAGTWQQVLPQGT